MQSTGSTSNDDQEEEDHTGPPPQHPPFMPQNISSAGGNVTNKDSFNIRNIDVNDAFNNNSRTYYHGPAPPTDQRHPQRPSIYEEGTIINTVSLLHFTIMSLAEEEDVQSNSRSTGNGAWFNGSAQVHFQGGFPQHMRNGMSSGPLMSVDSPLIQHMDPKMRRDFEKLMQYTKLQTEPSAPRNIEGNDESDDDDQDSSSHNMEEEKSITPRMANLSMNDHMPSSTLNNESPIHLSALPTFSTNKSDPQIALQPTTPEVNHPMGSTSSPHLSPYNGALQHSHSNPSMAPHMKESAMVQFLSQPTTAQPVDDNGSNVPNIPPPVSASSGFNFPPSSSGGPIFRTINGNLTKYDDSFHQTNLNSFNTEHNTFTDSFNDNSVVQSSEK
ncbi:hypothetical protein BYT27DRAFT_6466950 [Phlegmacium glaucopus]|nr:hypothetical protein BYT27DRAFT_6466950 [Phlegmacium glaucopus]